MKTLTRVATWIEAGVTVVIGLALRGSTWFLALVLRRGKHRSWRRRAEGSGTSRT